MTRASLRFQRFHILWSKWFWPNSYRALSRVRIISVTAEVLRTCEPGWGAIDSSVWDSFLKRITKELRGYRLCVSDLMDFTLLGSKDFNDIYFWRMPLQAWCYSDKGEMRIALNASNTVVKDLGLWPSTSSQNKQSKRFPSQALPRYLSLYNTDKTRILWFHSITLRNAGTEELYSVGAHRTGGKGLIIFRVSQRCSWLLGHGLWAETVCIKVPDVQVLPPHIPHQRWWQHRYWAYFCAVYS